jgi:protein CMS1
MCTNDVDSGGRKRKGNMKKLTRSQRNRLKKRKEVIATATANGEDVSEALARAGFVEQQDEKKDDMDEKKREKARKRIERLKKNAQPKTDGVARGQVYEDILWRAYAASFGYKDTVRESSGLVHETIHPSSPIPVSALESTLIESEPTTWESMFATPPQLSDPPVARPSAVFLSPSAVGALDCLKSCQTFHKGCHIAKLFAKHIKLPEQVDYIAKNPICMALGTPNRILKLASDTHVSFTELRYLILDMRENKKAQTMVDIPDIAGDFWNLWNTFLSPLRNPETTSMQFKILIVS